MPYRKHPHGPAVQRLSPPPPRGRGDSQACAVAGQPPVSNELWTRVEAVRRSKTQGGGPRRRTTAPHSARPPREAARMRPADAGFAATGRLPTVVIAGCARTGGQRPGLPTRRGRSRSWPRCRPSGSTRPQPRVVAALGCTARPGTIDRGRTQRQLRELGAQDADGSIADDAYVIRRDELRAQLADLDRQSSTRIAVDRAVE
jgi:hypothetical protein